VRQEHKVGGRLDYQYSSRTRLAVRTTKWKGILPFNPEQTGGATWHPSSGLSRPRDTLSVLGTLTKVLSNRAVNELKMGYAGYETRTSSPIV
jgi:hypothetical protein